MSIIFPPVRDLDRWSSGKECSCSCGEICFRSAFLSELQPECVRVKMRTLDLRTCYEAIIAVLWKIYRKYVGTFDVIAKHVFFLLYYTSPSLQLWLIVFFPPAGRWRISASARIQLDVSNTTFTAASPALHLHPHTNRGRRNPAGSCFQSPKPLISMHFPLTCSS